MAEGANIIELPLVAGQNEGIQREVLPPGQFSYLQNARYRKGRRLGKRHGYTAKTATNASGAELGNGNGRIAALGDGFCAVDDRAYVRDETADTWALAPQGQTSGVLASTRLLNRFPEFMPGAAFETMTVQSDPNIGGYFGTSGASTSAITYALGYIWTAAAIYSGAATTWVFRVNAIDPVSGRAVFQQDISPAVAIVASDTPQVSMLATGDRNTVVLGWDNFTAGTKTSVSACVLTGLTGGFSAEVTFNCIQSAYAYDPSVATGILFVYTLTGTPAELHVTRINPATMVATASSVYTLGGAKTLLSVYGDALGNVYVGYTDAGLFIQRYDASLTLTGVSANIVGALADAVGPLMFASRSATEVAVIADSSDALGRILVLGFGTSGGINGFMRQFNAKALSQPFSIGSSVYIWARHLADPQLGVATLLRVPTNAEYDNGALAPLIRSFPVQATLDGWDVDDPLGATTSGPPLPLPVSTPGGYVTLVNYTRNSIVAGTTVLMRGFAVVPVRHRSEGVRYSPGAPVACAGKHFVPSAQPMWVDRLGAYEAGFVQSPISTQATATAGGGALTVNSNYAHTAIFESIDANGMIERSAPAVPRLFTTGANTKATVFFSFLEFGQRYCRAKVYRTLANGSVFYLVNVVEASPALGTAGEFSFADTYADTDIIQNEPLYINIGQELAAAQFPSCSFACIGGNRLWVGGGFLRNVISASKSFVPHIAPEFADDDAFRVYLPGECTGLAWLDSLIAFTAEGAYLIAGDGPDASGQGFFTQAARLPFQIGCIEPRSVVTCEPGTFFQAARTLYLLPRGFGEPQAIEELVDTLTSYPIITSAAAHHSVLGGRDSSENVVQWTAVADESATSGVTITYDLIHKTWTVDTSNATSPAVFQAEWDGVPVSAPQLTTAQHTFRVQNSGFSDGGLEIDMKGVTGDIRPFGEFGHGIINRMGVLGEVRSACTFEVRQTTDKGESHWKERVYDLSASDAQVGSVVYLEASQGLNEQRDVTAIRLSFHESSTSEGFAPFGLYIESQKVNQGWRMLAPRDRVNVRPDAILAESGAEVLTTEDGEQLITEDGS